MCSSSSGIPERLRFDFASEYTNNSSSAARSVNQMQGRMVQIARKEGEIFTKAQAIQRCAF